MSAVWVSPSVQSWSPLAACLDAKSAHRWLVASDFLEPPADMSMGTGRHAAELWALNITAPCALLQSSWPTFKPICSGHTQRSRPTPLCKLALRGPMTSRDAQASRGYQPATACYLLWRTRAGPCSYITRYEPCDLQQSWPDPVRHADAEPSSAVTTVSSLPCSCR